MDLKSEFKRFDRERREHKIELYITQIVELINRLDKMGVSKTYTLEKVRKLT